MTEVLDERWVRAHLDYSQMQICLTCYQVWGLCSGPLRNLGQPRPHPLLQLCSCDAKRIGEMDKWPGFDFNEAVTLCYCCQRELLPSGSRWSVWFCEDCKNQAIQFNREAGAYLIPIGRHSLMGLSDNFHLGLAGQDGKEQTKVNKFRAANAVLRVQIDALQAWRRDYLRHAIAHLEAQGLLWLAPKIDEDEVDYFLVADYLAAARHDMAEAKAIAFERMCRAIA